MELLIQPINPVLQFSPGANLLMYHAHRAGHGGKRGLAGEKKSDGGGRTMCMQTWQKTG
jgi:hypothetical protein